MLKARWWQVARGRSSRVSMINLCQFSDWLMVFTGRGHRVPASALRLQERLRFCAQDLSSSLPFGGVRLSAGTTFRKICIKYNNYSIGSSPSGSVKQKIHPANAEARFNPGLEDPS